MKDELRKQIGELLDKGQEGKGKASVHISMGDIVNSTVVIGGSLGRESNASGDDDDDSEGEPGDPAFHQELRSLRDQVLSLKQLVMGLYRGGLLNGHKQHGRQLGARPTSSVPYPRSTRPVPNYSRGRFPRPARSRTARQPAPHRTSRPAMSSSVPPNPTPPYVPYSLSPLKR